ncbi:MAG: prenyltransferase [Lentisphaerales bacterium]|nr:prenyltransferase [Lentisphaerales bacterium]
MKYLQQEGRLLNWLKVMRVSQGFFFISAMPVLLGSAMVIYHYDVSVSPLVFFLMVIGSLVYHLGADMINEYYDHISGNDALVDVKTPFSGGTGILEKGLIRPQKVLYMSWLFFLIGAIISFIIAALTNDLILIFSALGLISCWGYTAPPLKFCYRGIGEIIIFLNNGLFIIGAIFMAFVEVFDPILILPSFFLGFLGFSIIIMNEVPDIRADQKVNKKNLVVRFGIEKALLFHKIAITCAFSCIIAAVALKQLPWPCLLAFAGLFMVSDKRIFNTKLVLDKMDDPESLTGLCKSTIELKFKSWLMLMIGFAAHGSWYYLA